MKLTIRKMANIAVFAALAAVFSQISIPIGPVPINLALLAVFAAGGMLSAAEAVFAVMLFLVLGAAGLPVFAGFNAGLGALFGPTGGYLIGYLPAAFLLGSSAKSAAIFGGMRQECFWGWQHVTRWEQLGSCSAQRLRFGMPWASVFSRFYLEMP